MKYVFILISLFLTSCSSPSKLVIQTSTIYQIYKCTFFNGHGSYAHLSVVADLPKTAMDTAVTVRNRLIENDRIPNDCSVVCELNNQSYVVIGAFK